MNNLLQALRNHPIRLGFGLAVVVLATIGYRQLTGYQQLTIELREPSSGAVKVYRAAGADTSDAEAVNAEPTDETVSSTTIRVRKGTYVVTGGTDSPDFTRQLERVEVNDSPVTVAIDPPFSSDKLAALLEQERPAIHAAIKSEIPGIGSSFVLGPGELYEKGQWYGTVIYPNLTPEERRLNYVDVYYVVAHKEGDAWKVATVPPEMVLSSVTYPDIPFEILSATNNQKMP